MTTHKVLSLGSVAPSFRLPDPAGIDLDLNDHVGRYGTVIFFTCNHCPYSQAWEDRLIALARDFRKRGVAFLAINANATQRHRGEGASEMAVRATQKRFPFPYLLDDSQDIAHAYGATRTPELFIFDAGRRLCYHGAVDDNYDDPAAVTHRYAADALEALLAGRRPDPASTIALGCPIRFARPAKAPSVHVARSHPEQRLIYYSLSGCPTCVTAKAALLQRGIAFEERIVDDDELWQQEVFRLTGQMTCPVFVRGNVVEIGFEGEPGCHF